MSRWAGKTPGQGRFNRASETGPPLQHVADVQRAASGEPTEEITSAPPDRTPAEQQRFDAASAIASRLSRASEKNDEGYKEFFAAWGSFATRRTLPCCWSSSWRPLPKMPADASLSRASWPFCPDIL